jgi:DNA-binding GntR family transcriptional regulator
MQEPDRRTEGAAASRGSAAAAARRPNRLQMQTAERIVELIRRDRLSAGERLREQALAERLGVSRTPIRAALKMLSEQGLLIGRPNYGYALARDGREIDADAELPTSPDETLYMQIARDRVENRLPQDLTETFLMRRYGASRNLVMAALSRLSEEGLARRGKGRQWTFLEILNSPRAQQESYQLRLMLEPAALLLDSFSIDRGEVARLRDRHVALLDSEALVPHSRELFHIDASFHELLAAMSGNTFVLATVHQHNRLRRLIEYQGYPNIRRVRAWIREHVAILDALGRGKLDDASQLLGAHLRNASTALANGRAA